MVKPTGIGSRTMRPDPEEIDLGEGDYEYTWGVAARAVSMS